MDIPQELVDTFKEEVSKIDYGKITITVNKSGEYIELITEQRKRIWKDNKELKHKNYSKG